MMIRYFDFATAAVTLCAKVLYLLFKFKVNILHSESMSTGGNHLCQILAQWNLMTTGGITKVKILDSEIQWLIQCISRACSVWRSKGRFMKKQLRHDRSFCSVCCLHRRFYWFYLRWQKNRKNGKECHSYILNFLITKNPKTRTFINNYCFSSLQLPLFV